MDKVRITCVMGTRPEVIKMAPVVKALRESSWAQCLIVVTAQHRGLLDQALAPFHLLPDVDLDLMTEGQSVLELTGRILPALSVALKDLGAQAVLAQGDTATVFATGLVAYLQRIPFGHVEAGLRTHDIDEPFPEEGFRQMVARVARWHFAPTDTAAINLRAENIPESSIFVTGNTGIDSLLSMASNLASGEAQKTIERRTILLTAHRRESFGEPMARIFSAVLELVDRFPDIDVLYPVHPNPNVSPMAREMLGKHERIRLSEPLNYPEFVAAMKNAYIILTDSGGIQEEAPALGKPVLVLRDQTERPEALTFGVAKLIGTDTRTIVSEASLLLTDQARYRAMSVGRSPYGDGNAAPRIAEVLRRSFLLPAA